MSDISYMNFLFSTDNFVAKQSYQYLIIMPVRVSAKICSHHQGGLHDILETYRACCVYKLVVIGTVYMLIPLLRKITIYNINRIVLNDLYKVKVKVTV